MSKKILIIIIIGFFFAAGYFVLNRGKRIENFIKMEDFVQCLAEKGTIIYGSKYCPACTALIDNFGGYEEISLIYVECVEQGEKCEKEMQTNSIPEIQIKKEVYSGPKNLKNIGEAAECELPKI